jgi:hypothetical protein
MESEKMNNPRIVMYELAGDLNIDFAVHQMAGIAARSGSSLSLEAHTKYEKSGGAYRYWHELTEPA